MGENAVSLNLKILAWESRLKPREFTPTGNNFHLVSALDNLNTDKDTEIHTEFGVFGKFYKTISYSLKKMETSFSVVG